MLRPYLRDFNSVGLGVSVPSVTHSTPAHDPGWRKSGIVPHFLPHPHFPTLSTAFSRMAEGKKEEVLCARLGLGK